LKASVNAQPHLPQRSRRVSPLMVRTPAGLDVCYVANPKRLGPVANGGFILERRVAAAFHTCQIRRAVARSHTEVLHQVTLSVLLLRSAQSGGSFSAPVSTQAVAIPQASNAATISRNIDMRLSPSDLNLTESQSRGVFIRRITY